MRTFDPYLKSVAFLGLATPSGDWSGDQGTAFFLLHRNRLFIVTAAHCARKVQASGQHCLLRIGSHKCDLGLVNWVYHPERAIDVAVAACTQQIQQKLPRDEVVPIISNATLTEPKAASKNIGPGDQVAIVGLYRLRPGTTRALPIVHTGHIAMMPEATEPIPIADPCYPGSELQHFPYLIEAHSLSGLSGAPVFVRRSLRINHDDPSAPNGEFMAYGSVWLLGLWHGAWDLSPDSILEKDRNLSPNLRVPVGIGIAIPAPLIIEAMEYALACSPLDPYEIPEGLESVITSFGPSAGSTHAFVANIGSKDAEGDGRESAFGPTGS